MKITDIWIKENGVTCINIQVSERKSDAIIILSPGLFSHTKPGHWFGN